MAAKPRITSRAEAEEVLCAQLRGDNDSGERTVREYFLAIAKKVWEDGEGFSGKRPFGNSGWNYDIYGALVSADLISGTFDGDGYLEECDTQAGYELVMQALEYL